MSIDLMSKNFKAEVDTLDRIASQRAESFSAGTSTPRSVDVLVDPANVQRLAEARTAGLSVPLNDDGSIKQAPQIDAAVSATAPASVPVEDPIVARAPVERALTDAEVINKVKPFVDSSQMRPVFLSKPIDRRVYIGIYPSYGEMLAAERLLGSPARDEDGEVSSEYLFLSELSSSIRGFLFENDPKISIVAANPGDVSKWPKLHKAEFLNALMPTMRGYVIPQLSAEYLTWKLAVTPTDSELEKYFGLIG